MKNEILFSIVIPTYKGEESLFIALESINKQTYKNIEVIISDDNGFGTVTQKKTEEIINKYKSKLNIKYIINEHINGSHARNEGLKIAKGDYISLLDDDDFYLSTYVEDAINSFEDNDIVFFDTAIISEEGVYRKVSSPLINSKDLLFYKSEIGTGSNICFKRKIIDENNFFDERYTRHQDIEYVVKLLSKYNYKWIAKINIVKYFNNVNNYPTIEKALSMQKLLRDNMLESKIITKEEYEKLELYQLHGLYNDYLVKGAPKEVVETVYKKLKENDSLSLIDNCMFNIYKISKRLFKICFNIYSKKNIQAQDNDKNRYLDYRDLLIQEGSH